ncbi:MAG: triple tyrosine motif-containing protein [Bacteroidetes bacterium]|nr:triple tyrosine motif-containing protein [Bacteroidota bacterium]
MKHSLFAYIIPALCILTAVSGCIAQTPFLVTHFNKQDYNAGNQNWSIDSDAGGFIYAANNDGLLIFDGTDWSLYRNPDQTVLRSVFASPDGRIYTGSYEECGYWEKDGNGELVYRSLKPLIKHLNLHNDEIWKIISFKGKMYFQSFTSLFVYDQNRIRSIPVPGTIIFLLKAHDRLFVQSVSGMLYEVQDDILIPLDHAGVLEKTEVKTILPMPGGKFLIGTTSRGFFQFDGKTIRPWEIAASKQLREFQINNAIVNGKYLVVGTIVRGILILDFNGNVVSHLNTGNYLQNNTVLSLCADANGTIWAALDKGIDRISMEQGIGIYQEKPEQLGAVYSAALFENSLYVGTNRGIFSYRFDPSISDFRLNRFIRNSQGQVWDLKEVDGNLICGHTAGTYLLKDNELRQISGVSGGYSLRKFSGKDGEHLIQSTYSPLVIYRKQGKEWIYEQEVSGYQEPSRFLETDHLGNIWIGQSVKGLYKLRLNEKLDSVSDIRYFGKADGLPSDFNIHVFKVENRVVFTTGKLLYTWDDLNNKIMPYSELNNQLSGFEASKRIVDILDHKYWFIKKDDIALFEIKDGKASMLVHVFLPAYGIHMMEDYENMIRMDENRSLLCLDNGFAVLNLERLISAKTNKAKLIFRDLFCFDSKGIKKHLNPEQSPFTIPHPWNSVSIRYTYINSNNIRNLYQYKLSSIENDWSPLTEEAFVSYTRLPKGNYTFMVRSLNENGLFTSPIILRFKVFPAWYESTLAYLLYALCIILAFLSSTYLFRRRFMHRQEELRTQAVTKAIDEKQKSEKEIIKLQNEKLQSEIQHKTMQLADSTMSIIKKNELLIEIRKELDQQKKILGDQYPSYFFTRIHSLISRNMTTNQDWKIFEELFDQAHQDFFKRLKSSYPDLTQSDLKLCAYLKLNLSSKEIAPLLNISFRGVETRRYRIRKRLGLNSDSNLVEFIMQF